MMGAADRQQQSLAWLRARRLGAQDQGRATPGDGRPETSPRGRGTALEGVNMGERTRQGLRTASGLPSNYEWQNHDGEDADGC